MSATAALVAMAGLLMVVLAGFLLAEGFVPHRRRRRNSSVLAGLTVVLVLAGLVLVVVRPDAGLLPLARSVALVACYVGGLFVALLLYPVALRGRGAPRVDAIVVLGSPLLPGARVPPLLARRLDRAVSLWREARGERPLVVASGGRPAGAPVAESVGMARYLAVRGIPADRLLTEERSRTTRENLRLSRQAVEERLGRPARLLVVSSDFHTLRTSVHCLRCRRSGLHASVRAASTPRRLLPASAVRELAVILKDGLAVHLPVCAALALLPLVAAAFGR